MKTQYTVIAQLEQTKQTLDKCLHLFISYQYDDWHSMAKFSYNNSIHAFTKQTPFYVVFRQHP